MSFLGWIALYKRDYYVDDRDDDFLVIEYQNGEKVLDSRQLYTLQEFKEFVARLDIDPALLPQKLQDVLHSDVGTGNVS